MIFHEQTVIYKGVFNLIRFKKIKPNWKNDYKISNQSKLFCISSQTNRTKKLQFQPIKIKYNIMNRGSCFQHFIYLYIYKVS